MKINKDTALKLWNERYGNLNECSDYAGRIMYKSAYDNRSSDGGFNIDHIFPQSKGGTNEKENLVLCNILTNDEKADKTTFKANGKSFQVKRIKGTKNYEICSIDETIDDSLIPDFLMEDALKEREDRDLLVEKEFNSRYQKDNDFLSNPALKFMFDTYWEPLFGTSKNAQDFANRPMYFNHYGTNDPDSWVVIPANSNVPLGLNNCLIVNKKTSEEIDGRTNFTINNIQYSIIKNSDGGYNLYSESNLNVYEPDMMLNYFNKLKDEESWNTNIYIYLDNGDTYSRLPVDLANRLYKFCSKIIDLDNSNNLVSQNVKSEKGFYNLPYRINYSFDTPLKEDIKNVISTAVVINSYFSYLCKKNNFKYKIIIESYCKKIDAELDISEQRYLQFDNTIYINSLAFNNAIKGTEDENFANKVSYGYNEYNVVKTKINKKLKNK